MKRSGSQKILLFLSVINIALGTLVTIAGIMSLVAGSAVSGATADRLVEAGVSPDEQAAVAQSFMVIGATGIIGGLISIAEGIFGVRAANDNSKIMPVWIICIVSLVAGVVGIIISVFQGTFSQNLLTNIASLVCSAVMFWIANNVKVQAGK